MIIKEYKMFAVGSFLFLLFGVCATCALGATFVVSNFNDSGAGSLRQAILDANAAPGTDLIQVSHGVGTINLVTPLPPVTDTAQIINFDTGSGRVELNGLATRGGELPSIGFD